MCVVCFEILLLSLATVRSPAYRAQDNVYRLYLAADLLQRRNYLTFGSVGCASAEAPASDDGVGCTLGQGTLGGVLLPEQDG